MQRARRLASIAVIAVLGTTVLSACRSDSSVAAYVGDRKITEDEVSKVLDDARSKVPPGGHVAGATPQPGTAPGAGEVKAPTRSEVVSTLVMREVCTRLAADKGFKPVEQAPADRVAEQLGLPPGSSYVQIFAEVDACKSGIPAGQPVAPTQQELSDLVAKGRTAGVIPPDAKDDEAGRQLDGELLRGMLATRNTLASAVADFDVVVNPRYRPLSYTVLPFSNGSSAVSLEIGESGSGTVIDAR